MIKIGFDVHGVIDADPSFFCHLGWEIKKKGGEVHIITGKSWSKVVDDILTKFSKRTIWWTHYFSIDDYLGQVKRLPFIIDAKGGRHYDEGEWNRAKAEYCLIHQIDLHVDDHPEYLQYFKTPSIRYICPKESNELVKRTIERLFAK